MKNKIYALIAGLIFIFTSCSDDLLDRPPKDRIEEDKYWIDEQKVRLFANNFYPYFFVGYNTGYGTTGIPVRGMTFSDDVTLQGQQSDFPQIIPSSLGSSSGITSDAAYTIQTVYGGPSWYFGWIRETNIMVYRVGWMFERELLTEAQYKHWLGVARFFRGLEYMRLVATFGDVPYYDIPLYMETDPDILYKDRDSRDAVVDKIYEDFDYALKNVRQDDGLLFVNKDVVASLISRWMLFEGTWQKYHLSNTERSKKMLNFAVSAANTVMASSNKYAITGDYRSVFSSNDLRGNKEVIFYRAYDTDLKVMHSMVGYCNLTQEQTAGVNLNAIRAFICNDGKPWQHSSVADAGKFDLKNLVKTRDPRFEAIFHDEPVAPRSSTRLYTVKYAPRESLNKETAPWGTTYNVTDAPVLRYAEVLLNWIEAKAELATMGEVPVSQADIDFSINALRDRVLAPEAIAKGVKKTPHLDLATLSQPEMVDPDMDNDGQMTPLLWEIRRERRMELMQEYPRLLDLRRWKKLDKMDNVKNPYYKLGPWIDFSSASTTIGATLTVGTKVVKEDLTTVVTYDGTNRAAMIGYYMVTDIKDRDSQFIQERSYLSPIGETEITKYANKGYVLTQTDKWR